MYLLRCLSTVTYRRSACGIPQMLVSTPSPEGRAKSLEDIYVMKNILLIAHHVGETQGTSSIDVRRLKTRIYNIRDSMTMQKSITRIKPHVESLDLLQRPPYACESWCQLLHLPPWQDVAAELHAQGLLNADLSLSSSP